MLGPCPLEGVSVFSKTVRTGRPLHGIGWTLESYSRRAGGRGKMGDCRIQAHIDPAGPDQLRRFRELEPACEIHRFQASLSR